MKNGITVETKVIAPIDKVWDCFTQDDHITQWNFANDDWHCPKANNNLVPEGKFSYNMAAKDGSFSFDFEGTYDKIIKHELISYKLEDGRQVEIAFKADGDHISVVETFEAEGTNADEQQRAGWQAILGNFKQYVEGNT